MDSENIKTLQQKMSVFEKWLQFDLDIKDTNEDRDQIKNYIGSIWRKLQNAIFLMEQATNVCVNEQSCNNEYSDSFRCLYRCYFKFIT